MEGRDRVKESFNKKRVLFLPYFSILLVLIVTTGATYLFYRNAADKDEIRFENDITKINANLENEISKQIVALKASKHIIESDQRLNLKDNYHFAEVRDIGILEYTKKIISTSNNFTDLDLTKDFQIKDLDKNNIKLESIDKDVLAESAKYKRTGLSKIEFKELEGSSLNGYVLVLPVFENAEDSASNKSFRGFVFYPFSKDSLLENIYKTSSVNDIGFKLSLNNKKVIDNNFGESNLNAETMFETLGIKWTVEYMALPVFFDKSSIHPTTLIPIGGIFIGVLIFGFLRFEAQTKVELAEIAEELSIAKSQEAKLLESEQKARKAAEDSNRLKDEFISMISHEIRTPLNSIAGWTNILNSENITEETKQRALKIIKKNIKTQSEIIDELLLFSDLNNEKQILNNDLTRIAGIVENEIDEVASDAIRKEIHFIKDIRLNGEKIYCDKKKISKAIRNLLENAIKFTPKGGEIKFLAVKSENSINLKIKDSGKGIEKEFLPHIFDKFRQADSSTTRNFGGLGLGLAISKRIIMLHGGEIHVTSEGENKGTEFEITLPKNN